MQLNCVMNVLYIHVPPLRKIYAQEPLLARWAPTGQARGMFCYGSLADASTRYLSAFFGPLQRNLISTVECRVDSRKKAEFIALIYAVGMFPHAKLGGGGGCTVQYIQCDLQLQPTDEELIIILNSVAVDTGHLSRARACPLKPSRTLKQRETWLRWGLGFVYIPQPWKVVGIHLF